jgi:hypothetical protein
MYLTFMGPCIVDVFLSMTNKMQRCIKLLIIVNAVRVSSGFSAHHQELQSVRAASGICQTCLVILKNIRTLYVYVCIYIQYIHTCVCVFVGKAIPGQSQRVPGG